MVLADVNTFFQDYVLNQSEGDNLFFNKYVAGFTLADTSAGGILLTGWYSNEVSSQTLKFQTLKRGTFLGATSFLYMYIVSSVVTTTVGSAGRACPRSNKVWPAR